MQEIPRSAHLLFLFLSPSSLFISVSFLQLACVVKQLSHCVRLSGAQFSWGMDLHIPYQLR